MNRFLSLCEACLSIHFLHRRQALPCTWQHSGATMRFKSSPVSVFGITIPSRPHFPISCQVNSSSTKDQKLIKKNLPTPLKPWAKLHSKQEELQFVYLEQNMEPLHQAHCDMHFVPHYLIRPAPRRLNGTLTSWSTGELIKTQSFSLRNLI
jgi:hypothetical protein